MHERERRKMDLLLARFVEAMTAWNWSKRTIPAYRQNVREFLNWLERETEATTLAEVTGEMLSAYQTALLTAAKPSGEPLSIGTQHARLSVLKSFFRFLAHEGKLLADPAVSLSLPKKRRPLPQALLTPKEALRLLEASDVGTPLGLRDRAMLEVLYATGIRNAELRGLGVADFDPESGTLTVKAGKGNKDRVVPIGPVGAAMLGDYLARARPKLARRPEVHRLFLTKNGAPLDTLAVIGAVRRAAKRAGIKKPIRPHRLRHACATHMLQGGADIRHIQKLLGHESLQTTQIYTKVEIGDLKAVHRKFHPRERGGK